MSDVIEYAQDDAPLNEADLLEEMVMAIVDHPEHVRVDSQVKGNSTALIIYTDPRDCGKVIGKSGRTVDAIRTFLGVVASRSRRYVTVNMADERKGAFQKDRFRYNGHTTIVDRSRRKVSNDE